MDPTVTREHPKGVVVALGMTGKSRKALASNNAKGGEGHRRSGSGLKQQHSRVADKSEQRTA